MATDAQKARFADTGLIRISGAFGPEQATAMRESVWRYMERRARVRIDDPETWPRPGGLGFKNLKGSAVFSPFIENRAVGSVLDGIFDPLAWAAPKSACHPTHGLGPGTC